MNRIILFLLLLLVPLNFALAKSRDTNSAEEQVQRGQQLVNEGRCNDCHTPTVQTSEGLKADTKRILSGHPSDSEIPKIPNADIDSEEWINFVSSLDSTVWAGESGIVYSANLTPDPQTGIGKWNEKIFIQLMRSGRHVDLKRDIQPPMPWQDYAKLSNEDLKAVFLYLSTLKPVYNPVPKPKSLR